jgi:hypothetical protein
MRVAVAVKGMAEAKPRVPSAVRVVPAHSSAVPDLTTRPTWLVPPAGSAAIVEASAPPKPRRP